MQRAVFPVVLVVLLAAATALPARAGDFVLSVVGTNDWHGHIESFPAFAGAVKNLRAARAQDGAVLLVDGGDIFQGTLESNLGEGAVMIEAMNAVGYDAVAVGNHEFDFGPVGEKALPKEPGDDPRGALKERLAQAKFPFLTANVIDADTGKTPTWPNLARSVLVVKGKVKVGIVGGSTESTPMTTVPLNFKGLSVTGLADAIRSEAQALRQRGATIVVAVVHAGGRCTKHDVPADLSSCSAEEEAFLLARALPPGTIDVIVGGHTHQPVAHVVNGTAVIESWANGRGFGRVDLIVDEKTGKPKRSIVFPPTEICKEACTYQGAPVVPDAQVAQAAADDFARAAALKGKALGVVVEKTIKRSYEEESALGNLFADMLRGAVKGADVGLTNGGGLRADLKEGALTFGAVYEAMPFDNRLAIVTMSGGELRRIVEANLSRTRGSVISLSGLRVVAKCAGGAAQANLVRPDGRVVKDDERVVVVTNDFLATGGDGALGTAEGKQPGFVVKDDERLMRDVIVAGLAARGGSITAGDFVDPKKPRIDLSVQGPLRCTR